MRQYYTIIEPRCVGESWTYNLFRPLSLIGIMAPRQYFCTFRLVDDESLVAACLDAVVDLDIPIFQRRSHRLDLALDALLDGGKDNPRIGRGERAGRGRLLHENARLFSSGRKSQMNLASVLR